jgi:hypothetical protein
MVLHIGTHKTATTSIQTMVGQNLDKFPDLYYPKTGLVGYGQHNIAWQVAQYTEFDPALGTLEDLVAELERERPARVLISAEDFCATHDPQWLRRLADGLRAPGFQVSVVVSLRQRDEYLESFYLELLKHGYDKDFATFIESVLGGDLQGVVDYELVLNRFASVFGAENVYVIPYDRERILDDFFRTCSVLLHTRLTPVPGWERRNSREDSDLAKPQLTSEQWQAIEARFGTQTIPSGYQLMPPPGDAGVSLMRRLAGWLPWLR